MGNFLNYIVGHGLWNEVSTGFPRDQINALLSRQIDEVIPQITDPEVKSDAISFRSMDFVGYISRSVRSALSSAGFPDEAGIDGHTSDLITKLLFAPGGLVSKWRRDAPLSYRFKRAVKNWITTLAERTSRRRRRFRELPDDQIAREQPRDDDDLIADFRRWLENQYGLTHRLVFDARVEGREIKSLINQVAGIPSSHRLKTIVQQIKAAAVRWARTDPAFQMKVQRLMDAEAATLAKRFGRVRV